MNIHLIFTALLAALMASASAQATVIDLWPDPDGGGYSTSAMSFSNGGLSVIAQGQVEYGGNWYSAPMDSFGNYGLAIKRHRYDSHQIDGFGPNERVHFTFDHHIRLVSASFTYVGWDDDFAFWALGSHYKDGVHSLVDELYPSTDIPNSGTYNFVHDWVGKTFAIGALGWNDDFKLRSVKVEKVSEPTTFALLGIGLVALGLSRRNRS